MKRSEIKRRPLPETTIRHLEPETRAYYEKDSKRLSLRVNPKGSRDWQYRYKKQNGKDWTWAGLGGYPSTSSKRARALAEDYNKRADAGEALWKIFTGWVDPDSLTLKQVCVKYIAYKSQTLADSSIADMSGALNNHIIPLLGDVPMMMLSKRQCTDAINALKDTKKASVQSTARKYLVQVCNWALGCGYCDEDPARSLGSVTERYQGGHLPSLVESEIKEFMQALKTSTIGTMNREAVYMVLFTIVRNKSIQTMHWDDIDLSRGLWTIPASSMKGAKSVKFTCPLVTQLIDMLSARHFKTGYVFTPLKRIKRKDGTMTETMSDVTLGRQFMNLGFKGRLVPHGCRHMASTLLNEHGWDSRLVEAQLAHKLPGVAGIYNQAEYVEKRREMMQWYADHLMSL